LIAYAYILCRHRLLAALRTEEALRDKPAMGEEKKCPVVCCSVCGHVTPGKDIRMHMGGLVRLKTYACMGPTVWKKSACGHASV